MSTTETSDDKTGDTINEAVLDLAPGITEDDKLLWKKDKNAVEFSLNYAKLWSKFCKDLVVTLEKKASIENDSNRSIMKSFQAFESTLGSSSMIGAPLRNETISMCKLVMEQVKEMESQNTKKLGRLLDGITRQRNEFNKTRKHYKDKWKNDCKKMSDAENYMLKTRAAYYQRCQQGVKLREELTNAQSLLNSMLDQVGNEISTPSTASVTSPLSAGSAGPNFDAYVGSNPAMGTQESVSASQLSKHKQKVDKLEKQLADNDKKEIEQMYSYKESVETANHRLIEFEKKKLEHLCDIRLTTVRSDETVKDTLAEYVRILTETRLAMFKEFAALGDKFQEYKPCQEYCNLIDKQTNNKPDSYPEKFQVELFHDSAVAKEKSESQLSRGFSRFGIGLNKDSEHDSKNRNTLPSHSDSDSDSEMIAGPPYSQDTPRSGSGGGVLNTIVEFGSNLFAKGAIGQGGSQGGAPGSGAGSSASGGFVKKSTSGSTSSMGTHTGHTSEDAEWQREVVQASECVLYCINAIENQEDGLKTHGIYRVSASKSKVNSMMELLATGKPNLENESPITLASAVKSKLIGLSEPLVPYSLYTDFVELGKEAESVEGSQLVSKLKGLILQVPFINKKLLGLLLHHLKKVANNADENQMGSTNLGTLFAPTLIKTKPRFRNVDIKEYMDNKSQAKIVQVIIEYVNELFGDEEQYYDLKYLVETKDSGSDKEYNRPSTPSSKATSISQRPYSSILDSSCLDDSILLRDDDSLHPQGSLKVPSSSSSSTLHHTSTTTTITSEATVKNEAVTPALSPRLRAKKSTNSISSRDEEPVSYQAREPSPALYSPDLSNPHRSTSVGSGPSAHFKLATLSQPATDSVFSKKTSSSEQKTSEVVGDRSIRLKQSFIAGNNITTVGSSSTANRSYSMRTPASSSSYTGSSGGGSAISQPKTSSTSLKYNYSKSFSANPPTVDDVTITPPDDSKPRSISLLDSIYSKSPFNRLSQLRQPLVPKHTLVTTKNDHLFNGPRTPPLPTKHKKKATTAFKTSILTNFFAKRFRSLDNISSIHEDNLHYFDTANPVAIDRISSPPPSFLLANSKSITDEYFV